MMEIKSWNRNRKKKGEERCSTNTGGWYTMSSVQSEIGRLYIITIKQSVRMNQHRTQRTDHGRELRRATKSMRKQRPWAHQGVLVCMLLVKKESEEKQSS